MEAAAVAEVAAVTTACLGLGTSSYDEGGEGSSSSSSVGFPADTVVLDSNGGTRPLMLAIGMEIKQQSGNCQTNSS